jgi:hypothetical protein
MELPVDVADHVDGRLQLQQHRLPQEDLSGHQAELADLVLGQMDLQGLLPYILDQPREVIFVFF